MTELTRLEKERNIRPSPEIDAFMKVIILNLAFLSHTHSLLVIFLKQIKLLRHQLLVVDPTAFPQIMS